jgi:putative ABC transport system permease protein
MFRFSAWRTIVRLAWRDVRASRTKATLLIAAVAMSVGSEGGVHSAAVAARAALSQDSRVWLGGDISVTTGDPLNGNQIAALDGLRASGIEWTFVTWVQTRAASDRAPDPALITVKAVDPAAYPYYGVIQLKPRQTLGDALDAESVAVSGDVLSRLQVRVGDHILIGGESFRIAALIEAEPDRFTGSLGLGPRCILSTNAFERSHVARSGIPSKYRVLLRLPAAADVKAVRQRLREIVPEGNILGYREANRHAIESVDDAVVFLEITALLALVLGAISLTFTIQQHLHARLDTFAIMKAVGGSGWQIIAVFALQIVWLLVAGLAAAAPLVYVVRKAVLVLAASYFVMLPGAIFSPRLMGYLALAGLASISPGMLQVMFQVRQLRPALLLRREAGDQAIRRNSHRFWAALLLLIALTILSVLSFDTSRLALLLVGVIAAIVLLVIGAAHLSLRLLYRGCGVSRRLSYFRLALRGISSPGNRSVPMISTLALGFMIMATTFVLQSVITEATLSALPLDRANLLILGVPREHEEEIRAFLAGQAGVIAPVDKIDLARLRLSRVNGVPLESLGGQAQADAFVNLVGCNSAQPPGRVAVAADVARLIGATPGSLLEFAGRSGVITASVSDLPNLTRAEKFWRTFVINCDGLDESDEFHQIAVRIRPDRVAAVGQSLGTRYPTLPALTAEDVEATVDAVSSDTIGLVRSVSWYAIASATAVMIAIVSASRAYRLREMGILSALGAGRQTMLRLYTVEFIATGALAGLWGALAACAVSSVVLIYFLHSSRPGFSATVIAGTICAATVVSVGAGWLPCYGLLRQKPLAILRRE